MLVFVAAEIRELNGFLAHLTHLETPGWPIEYVRSALWGDRPVILAANGPGPKLAGVAAGVVHENAKIDALISTGFCGGLAPELRPKAIFVATTVNGTVANQPQSPHHFFSGPLVSQDRVAVTMEEKRKLRESGAMAVEMEAGAVAARASSWSVPFYCVRVVTDTAEEKLPVDFNEFRDAQGRFSRKRIAVAALKRPFHLIPELMKLDARCNKASTVLGDFLADCRF